MRRLGYNAYGLELYKDAAEYACSRGLKVREGSFPDNIPSELRGIKFSLISMMECFYYIVDIRKCLEMVCAMLEDKGIFAVKW